jgi:hypothetical protein
VATVAGVVRQVTGGGRDQESRLTKSQMALAKPMAMISCRTRSWATRWASW